MDASERGRAEVYEMDLLSAPDIFPSRVTAVLKFLLAQRGQRAKRDELLAALSPRTLTDGTRMLNLNLEACVDMGVIVAYPNDETLLQLVPEARKAFRQNSYDSDRARLLLGRMICGADDIGNGAFCRALAWFLANDPMTLDTGFESVGKAIEGAGSGDRLSLRNATRYDQLAYWSVYMGMAWKSARGQDKPVPVFDPTEHLALVLPEYCKGHGSKGVPIVEVCTALASDWPVYPGGKHWAEVRHLLPAQDDGRIAPAIAAALARLKHRGAIQLDLLSDATGLATPRGDRITHVRWLSPRKGGR